MQLIKLKVRSTCEKGTAPPQRTSEADVSVPTTSALTTAVETYTLATSKAAFLLRMIKMKFHPTQNYFCSTRGSDLQRSFHSDIHLSWLFSILWYRVSILICTTIWTVYLKHYLMKWDTLIQCCSMYSPLRRYWCGTINLAGFSVQATWTSNQLLSK